jgi:hypothetical protein
MLLRLELPLSFSQSLFEVRHGTRRSCFPPAQGQSSNLSSSFGRTVHLPGQRFYREGAARANASSDAPHTVPISLWAGRGQGDVSNSAGRPKRHMPAAWGARNHRPMIRPAGLSAWPLVRFPRRPAGCASISAANTPDPIARAAGAQVAAATPPRKVMNSRRFMQSTRVRSSEEGYARLWPITAFAAVAHSRSWPISEFSSLSRGVRSLGNTYRRGYCGRRPTAATA